MAPRALLILCTLVLLGSSVAAEEESPWLLAPTVSSDPKLGTTVGGVAGYLFRIDPDSDQSLVTTFATYSNTDSFVGGVFGELYWAGNEHQIKAGAVAGEIHNEYDDFLGTGVSFETEDNIHSFFLRYLNHISGHWYGGAQLIVTNYAIGGEGIFDLILEQIGLTGFDSNGIGLVAEYDSRDNNRNPGRGQLFQIHNVAYREALGGDESFDTYQTNYSHYLPWGEGHVFATNLRGRWTHDAPQSGFSSLSMRGYTRGNYLDEHYSALNVDARFRIRGRWGASLFAGLGCLYSEVNDCGDGDALYPMAGGGIIFNLKPDAGIVMRLEYAQGKDDNSATYLSLGHPF